MKVKKSSSLSLWISLLCTIGFGFVALLVTTKKISRFDDTVISFIQGLNTSFLTSTMKFFTFIGSGIPIAVIMVLTMTLLYFVFKHRHELILFIGVVIGSSLLNVLLKFVFHRARPDLHRLIDIGGFSFPSGHAMAALSLYGTLTYLLWRHTSTNAGRSLIIIFSVFMMMMIGSSRIYLGVHYPSDVLGGFLASCAWVAISIWFYQRISYRIQQKSG